MAIEPKPAGLAPGQLHPGHSPAPPRPGHATRGHQAAGQIGAPQISGHRIAAPHIAPPQVTPAPDLALDLAPDLNPASPAAALLAANGQLSVLLQQASSAQPGAAPAPRPAAPARLNLLV